MIYGYVSVYYNVSFDVRHEIENYAKSRNLKFDAIIEDEQTNKVKWQHRELWKLINTTAKKGDELVVYEASNLARSTLQILEVLEALADKGLILHLIKYGEIFTAETVVNTKGFIHLLQNIESDFVAKRTTDALARRRAAGLPLGRPKGKKNRNRKLDEHLSEIKKYLALNISKASIAKLINCKAQTLYNYIEDKELESEAAAEDESAKSEKISK